jgi:ABC-2 type transport system permease protein
VSDHVLDPVTSTTLPRTRHVGWGRAAWRQYRLERRMFWRNPSAAFFNFLLPLLFLGLFGAVFSGSKANLQVIVPGIAGMSVMSTTFSALAMNLVYLRESGVLKRIHGTPLPTSAYLAGIFGNAVTNTAIQIAIVTTVGATVFGLDWPPDPVALVVFVVVGVCCFAAMGVALAHIIPNFDSAPAYVNAVFLPMIFISGVFYDAEDAPRLLRDIAEVLPLSVVTTAAREPWLGIAPATGSLVVVAVLAAVGGVLAARRMVL